MKKNHIDHKLWSQSLGLYTKRIKPIGLIYSLFVALLTGWLFLQDYTASKQFSLLPAEQFLELGKYSKADKLIIAPTISFAATSDECIEQLSNSSAMPKAFALAPCLGGSGDIGGEVFFDINNNGTNDSEAGQADIIVTIYDCDGNEVCSTTSDANGDWTCTNLTDGEEYRVEFTFPASLSYLQPSAHGPNNGTDVQYVTPQTCDVDYGIIDPSLYCQTNPILATPCFVNGLPTGNRDAFVSFPYSSSGIGQTGITALATNNQIGSTVGLAFARTERKFYLGAFLKRHVGLVEGLPGNPLGRIFVKDMNGANATSTGGVSQFINLEDYGANVGTIGTNSARGLAGLNDPSHDDDAYTKVGKVGLGDIDISADERFLYVVSLNDKKLFKIEIDADNDPSTAPVLADVTSVDIPAPGCVNGEWRPFGLKVHQGGIYVGGVCDGSANSTAAGPADVNTDMRFYVYKFDESDLAAAHEVVLDEDLDYPKGSAYQTGEQTVNQWFSWLDVASSYTYAHPQPMLSDIEFDASGSMILGFMDRYASQRGQRNYQYNSNQIVGEAVSAGDILKASLANSGVYTLESNASVGGMTGSNPNNNQGPGGGEFFDDNFIGSSGSANHSEISYGSLAIHISNGHVITNALDPVNYAGGNDQNYFRAGGPRWLNNTNGSVIKGFHLYRDPDPNATAIGKSQGLGDIELMCDPVQMQIGNYAWIDTDEDGVQDACEEPVTGLLVTLFIKDDNGDLTQVTTTTTDATTGEYYFNDVMQNTAYVIAFGDLSGPNITVGGVNYAVTSALIGEGNSPTLNDSDGVLFEVNGNMVPAICYNTANSTDHTLDVGFIPPPPPPCTLTITAAPNPCDLTDNTYELVVTATYENAPAGDLSISVAGGTPMTFTPSGTSPDMFTISGLASNGAMGEMVSANFVADTDCEAMAMYAAPAQCFVPITPPTPCVSGPGVVGGTVFNDLDNDGADNDNVTGQAGMLVSVFDCDGVEVCQTTTGADGSWSCSGLTDGEEYRVEFTFPASLSYLQPSAHGPDNGTDVQFVTPQTCEVDFGVIDPADYCEENPRMAVSCYIAGDPLVAGAAGTTDALVSFTYDETEQANVRKDVTSAEIGSTWGIAFNRTRQEVFAAAFVKRHVGLGPNGIGAIYRTNFDDASTPTSLLIDLANCANIGTILSNADRGLTGNPAALNRDATAFAKVAKVGLGDIDLSADFNTLFVSNLEERNILVVDLTQYNLDGTLPTCSEVSTINIPHPVCTNGVSRVFGLKVHDEKMFVALTCTGENGGSTANLEGNVLSYDLTLESWNTELNIPLNFTKGTAHAGGCTSNLPWTDTPVLGGLVAPCFGSNTNCICYPTPMLSDLEFDLADGSMLIGIMDRSGHQWGSFNLHPTSGNGLYELRISGDILKAANNNGIFVLESGGTTIDGGGCGANGQGPGGGEFFCQDWLHPTGNTHFETSMGALAHLPGSGEIVVNSMDPRDGTGNGRIFAGGPVWMNTTTGLSSRGIILYQGNNTTSGVFGKANGLGDIEVLCSAPPIEIGNYVWFDTDEDGVQDACEMPVPNLPVTLIDKNTGDVIAVTTTDATTGEYYFTETADGLEHDTPYAIVFGYDGNTPGNSVVNNSIFTIGSDTYLLTTNNSSTEGATDLNDSDASLMDQGSLVNYPIIMYTTADSTDYSLDVGLVPVTIFDLALTKVVNTMVTPGPFDPGDMVQLTIEVTNQGTLDAFDVGVADYFNPAELSTPSLVAQAGVVDHLDGTFTIDQITAGNSFSFEVATTIDNSFAGTSIITNAEITSGSETDNGPVANDEDSTPGNNSNTPPEIANDNVITDLQDGSAQDDDSFEDDYDPVEIMMRSMPTFVSIGSTVFEDDDNNGMQDSGEDGIANVLVILYSEGGDGVTDGVDDTGVVTGADGILGNADDGLGPDGLSGTADDGEPGMYTNTMGDYYFSQLMEGDYYVEIPMSAFAAGEGLENIPISSNMLNGFAGETDPDSNSTDGDDEGLQPGGSGMITTSNIITLAVGNEPTDGDTETAQGNNQDSAADADGNMTVDFGFFAPVSLGDTTWVDTDMNGLQDAGEPFLENVTVTLFNADGSPVMMDAEGNPYTSTRMTDGNGFYEFANLPPGDYYVVFDISTVTGSEFFTFTTGNTGGDDENDSDADPNTGESDNTGPINSGGRFPNLDAGVVCIVEATVANPATICSTAVIDLTQGASITPASLGGTWSTPNGTGTFDSGTDFATATTYTPSSADAQQGFVTLVMTTNDPDGLCDAVSAAVTFQILKVDCGTFPWDGN